MQPIFFNSIYKDYLWGGTKIKEYFHKDTPYLKTAESWEIASNKNGTNQVKDGIYEGKTLEELFDDKSIRTQIFGKKCENLTRFPILIKFIDAKANLSVQVHPDDEYAKRVENDIGKSEMWYVIDCKPNTKIICGLNDKAKNKEKLEILKDTNIESYFNYIDIQKNDVIYIPSGTIHAILADTLICEIQQNSDLTYRIYDWNRVDKNGKARQLHIDKAKEVIKKENNFQINHTKEEIYGIQNIIQTPYFSIDKVLINEKNSFIGYSNPNCFIAVNVIEGMGTINNIKINQGDSFLIPANMGKYIFNGNLKVLMSYINKKQEK